MSSLDRTEEGKKRAGSCQVRWQQSWKSQLKVSPSCWSGTEPGCWAGWLADGRGRSVLLAEHGGGRTAAWQLELHGKQPKECMRVSEQLGSAPAPASTKETALAREGRWRGLMFQVLIVSLKRIHGHAKNSSLPAVRRKSSLLAARQRLSWG